MDREQQIAEMAKVINKSPWKVEQDATGVHINSYEIAEYIYNEGYRKQSEVAREISEAVKHIAEGVKFKNDVEKTAFVEMLDDLTRVKMKAGE